MKILILYLNLTLMLFFSCSKVEPENESAVYIDTYFDLYVENAQGHDLLAMEGSEYVELVVYDQTAGEISTLAPLNRSFLLISPEGNDPNYRLRVYFNPKFEKSELQLRWKDGAIDKLIAEISKQSTASAYRTKVYLNTHLIFDADSVQGPPAYTIVKSEI